MKRKFFLSITAFCTLLATHAQESIISDINEPLLQKYINLAMAHYPLKKGSDANVDKAKAQINIATLGILDIFNAAYFYSPQKNNLILIPGASPNGTNNITTSGFTFGITLNLGNVFTKPAMIKSAKADYNIALAQNEDYKLTLSGTVKSAYYDYLASKKQLELSTLGAKDLRSILSNAQTQFQNGTITIDVYTAAKSASLAADAGVLTAEVTYLKSINSLENLIGEKLGNVQ